MERFNQLQEERKRIEKRLDDIQRYLQSPGIIDFKEIDEEGFPSADRDTIIAIRKVKHEYNCLQNDYSAIMEELTTLLYAIHSEKLSKENIQNNQTIQNNQNNQVNTLNQSSEDIKEEEKEKRIKELKEMKKSVETQKTNELSTKNMIVPLAIIKRIDSNSPAEKAGLEVGDIILKYNGYSTTIEENTLQTIAELTRAYSPDENGIIIEVTREGDVIRTRMIQTISRLRR